MSDIVLAGVILMVSGIFKIVGYFRASAEDAVLHSSLAFGFATAVTLWMFIGITMIVEAVIDMETLRHNLMKRKNGQYLLDIMKIINFWNVQKIPVLYIWSDVFAVYDKFSGSKPFPHPGQCRRF